ncbi:MAG: hypothetical protein IPQ07_22755 [Myxococcales bacterium]|nr:hypothetical protein [Myxococcales bacterium]
MREGWSGDDYLILFDEDAARLHAAYGLTSTLPGYRLLGLRSWDDFIIEDSRGARFTIPTVPTDPSYLAPFEIADGPTLEPDEKVHGRIKWYVTPLVFGGAPDLDDNVSWIPLDQHTKLVVWWNQKYLELRTSR